MGRLSEHTRALTYNVDIIGVWGQKHGVGSGMGVARPCASHGLADIAISSIGELIKRQLSNDQRTPPYRTRPRWCRSRWLKELYTHVVLVHTHTQSQKQNKKTFLSYDKLLVITKYVPDIYTPDIPLLPPWHISYSCSYWKKQKTHNETKQKRKQKAKPTTTKRLMMKFCTKSVNTRAITQDKPPTIHTREQYLYSGTTAVINI